MHTRGSGRRGLLHRGQRLPRDVDQRARILRSVAAVGHDDGDRLTDEARAVAGEQVEVLPAKRGMRRHDRQRPCGLAQVGERHDAGDAGRFERARCVDAADARVGVWAADDGGVKHPRQRDVADVAPAALDQSRILLAEEPVADELHR